MEEWRDVLGWEASYQVSNLGRVRSKSRTGLTRLGRRGYGGNILKPIITKSGYPVVNLKNLEKRSQQFVHRLVLFAFCGEPPLGYQGCHNDGNRLNARLDNLRWDSILSNYNDRRKHGTSDEGEGNPAAKLTKSEVKEIKASSLCKKLLAAKYNVSWSNINNIKKNRVWKNV